MPQKIKTLKRGESKLYARLLAHSKKQYSNINFIIRAYENSEKQIFGIDYDMIEGGISICKGTADAFSIINFID
jgi:hypothetical protein